MDVLCGLFCGVSGNKGIVEVLKINILLLILFGLLFNIQPGGAQITPNSFVIIAF